MSNSSPSLSNNFENLFSLLQELAEKEVILPTEDLKELLKKQYHLDGETASLFANTLMKRLHKRDECHFIVKCIKNSENLNKPIEQQNKDFSYNWEHIFTTLERENCLPLLSPFFEKMMGQQDGSQEVPNEWMIKSKKSYCDTYKSNVGFYKLLLQFNKRFRENSIEFILLKGLSLTFSIYGSFGLRPFNDIDILIKKEDFITAHNILLSMGFRPDEKQMDIQFFLKEHFHFSYNFIDKKYGCKTIELHWDLFHKYFLNNFVINDFWKSTSKISFHGRKYRVLRVEHNIIYLCLHLERHALFLKQVQERENKLSFIFRNIPKFKLIWLTDIYFIIRKHRVDWSFIVENSIQWNFANSVHTVLSLINDVFDPIVPETFLKRLKDESEKEERISEKIKNRIFYNEVYKKNEKKWIDKIIEKNISVTNPKWQFRPVMLIEAIDCLFPNRNYFIHKYGSSFPLKYHRITHFLKVAFTLFVSLSRLFYYSNKSS